MDTEFDLKRALAFLQLCGIAYDVQLPQMPINIADGKTITNWQAGSWECVWGPVLNIKRGNLALIAKFTPTEVTNSPTYVVTIRGTDLSTMSSRWWSDDYQLDEDLFIGERKPFPDSDPRREILIADGTHLGLSTINQLVSNGMTITQFLAQELENHAGPPPTVAVTGHSLGGCLTTVFSLTLFDTLKQQGIVVNPMPCTFAAPTAGNLVFAKFYDHWLPAAGRFHNTLDAIPYWWADLAAMPTLYSSCNFPFIAREFFDYMEVKIWEVPDQPYVQPANGATALVGTEWLDKDWAEQVSFQHHWTTYLGLLQARIAASG